MSETLTIKRKMKEMIWFNQLAPITEHLDDHKLIIFCHMVKGSFTDLVLPLAMASVFQLRSFSTHSINSLFFHLLQR